MRRPPVHERAGTAEHDDEACLESRLTMDLVNWATSSPDALAQTDIDRCLGLGAPTIDEPAHGMPPRLSASPVGEDGCHVWEWPVHVEFQADHD